MNSNKGITMTSVIVYVIAMMLVIGIIATITSFFYTNVINSKDISDNISEITKFNMYFLEETANSNNDVLSVSGNQVLFKTGNTFTFQDKCIYLNNVRICENIENAQFEQQTAENGKKVIRVLLSIGENMPTTKTMSYVVNNM